MRKAVDQNVDAFVHFPTPAASKHQNCLFHVLLERCRRFAKASKCNNFPHKIGAPRRVWSWLEKRGFAGMHQLAPLTTGFQPPKRHSGVHACLVRNAFALEAQGWTYMTAVESNLNVVSQTMWVASRKRENSSPRTCGIIRITCSTFDLRAHSEIAGVT